MNKNILFSLLIVLSGCASKKLNEKYTSENIKKFTQVALIAPITSISEMGKGNENNDDQTNRLIITEFKSLTNTFVSKTSSTYYGNELLSASDFDSLYSLMNEAFSGNVSQIKIEGKENIFSKIKEDKIIINYIKGFYKTKSRNSSEFGKALWISMVTLGMYIPVYYKYGISLTSVMIDKKNGEVIYRENIFNPMDPREVKTLEYAVNQSISKYFDYK